MLLLQNPHLIPIHVQTKKSFPCFFFLFREEAHWRNERIRGEEYVCVRAPRNRVSAGFKLGHGIKSGAAEAGSRRCTSPMHSPEEHCSRHHSVALIERTMPSRLTHSDVPDDEVLVSFQETIITRWIYAVEISGPGSRTRISVNSCASFDILSNIIISFSRKNV